jgi:hypothetical protein
MSIQKPGPTSNTNTNTITNQTSSQNASKLPPEWFTNAWQTILGLGGDIYGNLATPVAGLTTDQQSASMWMNEALQQYIMQRPRVPALDVFGMGNQWDQGAYPVSEAGFGGINTATAGQATPASMSAAQLDPGEIGPFMNPFIDKALDPTLNRLRQQQGEVQSDIGAKAAASGMFGGSREAVQRSLADRNYRDTLGQTAGNMLLQGWNTAAGLAGQNAGWRQQANLTNAQLDNAIRALNAQLQTQVSLGNMQAAAQLGGQLAMFNAEQKNRSQQQLQQLRYSGAQSDAQRFLQAVGMQNEMDLRDLQGVMAGTGQLNQFGTQQQQTAQAGLDSYWKQLNMLAQLLRLGDPGYTLNSLTNQLTNQNQTGTTTTSKPLDLGSVLLGALKLGL